MAVITLPKESYYGTKAAYLNDVLKVRNRNGELFVDPIYHAMVQTSNGRYLWFAGNNSEWNKYFRDNGVDYIRENQLNETWNDFDEAEKSFLTGEKVVRSVICRQRMGNRFSNKYFGEYQLVELNAKERYRLWKRVADSVELETFE
jgi:hypothetical protein